jgi:predicted nicotinamide N-methyase
MLASPCYVSSSSLSEKSNESDAVQDRRRRFEFLSFLRTGIREKVHQQHHQKSKHQTTNNSLTKAWQTLSWRDVFSTRPFFEETICGQPLKIRQILQGELKGFGTGLTVWPAACLLLKYLEYRFQGANKLNDQYIIELGSGTGAVGIAAAMLGASRVVVTDMKKLLFLMQENVDLYINTIGTPTQVEVIEYEWGETSTYRLLENKRYPEWILVSDCILPKLYQMEPLVEALDKLSQRNRTRILISYEHRYYPHFDPKQKFWKLMHARGFELRQIQQEEYHPDYQAQDIEVWEIFKK